VAKKLGNTPSSLRGGLIENSRSQFLRHSSLLSLPVVEILLATVRKAVVFGQNCLPTAAGEIISTSPWPDDRHHRPADDQRPPCPRLGCAATELPHSDATPSLDEARAWCRQLAESHYENFHVATWFLSTALRPHFYAIYAYCRISDDLGDEVPDKSAALALLDLWGRELDACYEGRARHPVFVALAEPSALVPFPRSLSPIC